MPVRAEPTVPAVPEPSVAPVRIAVTVFVSPLSTSVSLVSTLPVAFEPAVPLFVPPASVAVPVSSTPTGASLAPVIVIASTAVSVRAAVSATV